MDVTPIGIRRRLRALAAVGHPDTDVAEWLKTTVDVVRDLQATGDADEALAASVVDVCARWATQPGRCDETRRRARAARWRTVYAWEDDREMDVPPPARPPRYPKPPNLADPLVRRVWDATPDVVVQLLTTVAPEEVAAALVAHWARSGMPVRQIAAALRVNRHRVTQLRRESGVPACDAEAARAWHRGQAGGVAVSGPCPDCLTKLADAG
jgi:hypothetical protein